MMISSRISFSIAVVVNVSGPPDVPVASVRRRAAPPPGSRTRFLRDEDAAEVEPIRARLGHHPGYVRLGGSRAPQGAYLVPMGMEQLGDQAPVALPPRRLRAHQGGRGPGEGGSERLLPAGRRHPCRVGAESRDPDAAVPLLAGLVREPAAEVDRVPIGDACSLESRHERASVELGVAARAGIAPDVDERLHPGGGEEADELLERTRAVSDRVHDHGNTITGGRYL